MEILVIGSKGHKRAHCIDWLTPFPNIEEYDSVIINLQSLTQEIFNKISSKISTELKKEIKTLFDTDRETFCVIDQFIIPSPPATGFKARSQLPPTNYDWLPVMVGVVAEKPGTSMTLIENRFEKYMETVGEWVFTLDLYREPPLKVAVQQTYAQIAMLLGDMTKILRYEFLPIAENKSKKTVAGTLVYKGMKERGKIHLLPPSTKCGVHEAIEILLDLVCGKPAKIRPYWREEIDIPGIEDLWKKIHKKIRGIKKIQTEIVGLQSEVEKLDHFRDLLCATGENLERIVQKALSDTGISTQKAPEGFPVDLLSEQVAVEVTGIKGSVSVGSEKVNQIARFKESFQNREKVILVANTFMDLNPSDRKGRMNFTDEVKNYLNAADVCYMTSKTLLELWKDIKRSKRKARSVKSTILKHRGELKPEDER